MSTDTPIYDVITEDRMTISFPPVQSQIEISVKDEFHKNCGLFYITLISDDKKEPSTAQWIYRHLSEAQLALHVIQLKLQSSEKQSLYSDLEQLLNKMNLWDALNKAKLFKEIAAARLPFAATVLDRFDRPTVIETSRDIIEQLGDSYLFHQLSLSYNETGKDI